MFGEHYREHRNRICDVLKSHRLNHSIILLRSGSEIKEPFADTEHKFYQESLFFWLTGWGQTDSAIVIDVMNKKSILLIPDYDDDYEIWTGPILSDEEIIAITGVDEIVSIAAIDDVMEQLINSTHPMHRFLGYPEEDSLQIDDLGTLAAAASMARLIKSDFEIGRLREASCLTSEALQFAMKNVKPGMLESAVEAHFLFQGRLNGGECEAFPTIVASGQNAAFLHYTENKSTIKDGSFILVDCGMMVDHYAGDLTRTFPANGKFTDEQKLVYQLVLDMQLQLIELVRPGITIDSLCSEMFQRIFGILKTLGVITAEGDPNFRLASLFCPHSVSHHIGCDCHDPVVGVTSRLLKHAMNDTMELRPGMIISVEPGVYFNKALLKRASEEDQRARVSIDFNRAFQLADSIAGIRIEDDVLVTKDGHELLSFCPKTIEEIEKIMNEK